MTTSNENRACSAGSSTDRPAMGPQAAPVRHQRTQRLIEPRWQLGIACGVSLLILGSGALYMLGVRLVGSERVAAALGDPLHGFVKTGFEMAYFLGVVAVVHRIVVRMTHSVVGPAFAIERGLRALAKGDGTARFKLREGDSLVDVAAAAADLAEALASARDGREEELERIEAAAGNIDEVAAALERIRAIDGLNCGADDDDSEGVAPDAEHNAEVRLAA